MNFVLTELDVTAQVCCFLCFAALVYVGWHSRKAMLQGKVDNGAQNAVTIGVWFTFIGITVALLNFNTGNIADSIKAFLSGMKTAFFTSLMGMIAGVLIKWKQSDIIQRKEQKIQDNSDKTNEILIRVYECLSQVKNGIGKVEESVSSSNSVELSAHLKNLSEVLNDFTHGTEIVQKNMNKLAGTMESQIGQLSTMLGQRLMESNQKQNALLESMAENIKSMALKADESYRNSASLLEMTKEFHGKSLSTQQDSLSQLRDNTSQITGMKESFDNFLSEMAKRNNEAFIDALNKSIQELNQQLTNQLGDNFRHLDEAVKDLNTWQKEYKQIIISTTDELQSANGMFYEFSKQIVPSTQKTLYDINKCVSEYKENSDITARFTQELLQSRNEFVETAESMRQTVEKFKEFSDTYVDYSMRNIETYTKNSTDIMNVFVAKTNSLNEDILRRSKETIETYSSHIDNQIDKLGKAQEMRWAREQEVIERNLEELNIKINESGENVYLSIRDKLDKYDTMMEKSIKNISSTLEGFNVDFHEAISGSIAELNAQFATITQHTGEQGEKAVETLAGTLAKISEQMVDNYQILVDKIDEVDKLLIARGEK